MRQNDLTPAETRLLEAVRRLGTDAPMTQLARLARVDNSHAHIVRDRLRSLGRWPEAKAQQGEVRL